MNILLPFFVIIFTIILAIAVFIRIKKPRQGIAKLPYRRKDYLLTIAERKFYDVLSLVAVEQNYIVFAKVRLEDLLWLPKNTENRWGLRNRIKSRHIDFVLCDKQNLRPLLAIELDDSSHQLERRVERDDFIDKALRDAGLPILHVKAAQIYDQVALAVQISRLAI